ncbi:glycosyl hydrolase family 61 [Diplocarpon rosae]|nr:glycosyl hydrolase family 61 [Diplocarpon rosae]
MSFPTFSLLAALAATVSAHGYVDNATIGGTLYSRIFRPVSGNGPVDDITLIDIQCGGYTAGGIVGSQPAKLTAGPVAAGTDVEIRWTLWPDTHMGPVITYLAACPGNDCTTFVPNTDAVWFKIQEAGRVGTTNEWASTPLTKPGAAVTYTIPECLAPVTPAGPPTEYPAETDDCY